MILKQASEKGFDFFFFSQKKKSGAAFQFGGSYS